MRLVIFFFENISQNASQENEEPTPKREKNVKRKFAKLKLFKMSIHQLAHSTVTKQEKPQTQNLKIAVR